MKVKNTSRKGFTIVELVIVIAVIAILAAVLIPTFVSLVNKANNSADVQMVTNINKYLAAMEVADGKNTTMSDAVKDAEDAGYKAALLTAANEDNTILWDMKNDRFLVVNGKKIVAGLDEKKIDDSKMENYWIVSPLVDETYSTYYIGKLDENITLTGDSVLGFDVGERVVDLTYEKSASDVVLNGVFNSLTVPGTGKPVVHGYVYTLNGNVNADGAVFHGDVRSNVTASGTTVTYNVCYDPDNDGYCNFCKKEICKHTYEVKIDSIADCTHDGIEVSTCSKCNKVVYNVTAQLGHAIQQLEAIDATCTLGGQTAGEVCTREGCDYRKDGVMTPPLLHAYEKVTFEGKETWQCSRCKTYIDEHSVVDVDSLSSIDWKGQDKATDAIIVRLTSDITCTPEEFIAAFGSATAPHWIDAVLGTVGGTTDSTYENAVTVYAIDLDLNGHTLTINGETETENGVERSYEGILVYGHLRIRNAGADGKLVLNDWSEGYGSLISPCNQNGTVTFENLIVDADYNPVCTNLVADVKLNVIKSTLNLQKYRKTKYTSYPRIYVMYNKEGTEEYLQSYYGIIQKENGVFKLYDGSKVLGEPILYALRYDGKQVKLPNSTIEDWGVYNGKWVVNYSSSENYSYLWVKSGQFNVSQLLDCEGNPVEFGDQVQESWCYGNQSRATIDEKSSINVIEE